MKLGPVDWSDNFQLGPVQCRSLIRAKILALGQLMNDCMSTNPENTCELVNRNTSGFLFKSKKLITQLTHLNVLSLFSSC